MSRKWNINANVWRAGPFELLHQPQWLLVHAKHLLTGQVRIHKNSVIWPHKIADRMLTTEKVGCGSKIPWHILEPPWPTTHSHTLSGHPESDSEFECTKQNRCLIKWCFSNGRRKRPYPAKCNIPEIVWRNCAQSRHVTRHSWPEERISTHGRCYRNEEGGFAWTANREASTCPRITKRYQARYLFLR